MLHFSTMGVSYSVPRVGTNFNTRADSRVMPLFSVASAPVRAVISGNSAFRRDSYRDPSVMRAVAALPWWASCTCKVKCASPAIQQPAQNTAYGLPEQPPCDSCSAYGDSSTRLGTMVRFYTAFGAPAPGNRPVDN